jgi:hypothetical protein
MGVESLSLLLSPLFVHQMVAKVKNQDKKELKGDDVEILTPASWVSQGLWALCDIPPLLVAGSF